MNSYRWITGFIASLLLTILSIDVFSAELLVTRSFTGAWDQVNQESQGINLQVIEQTDDARVAVAHWYTYGQDRKSAWYLGVGHIVDDHINFDLYHSDDVGFMENGRPGDDSVRPIGTMTMRFDDCNNGMVNYDTTHAEVGSGSFAIGRITDIMNMHCSGGISDNLDARSMFGEQRLDLESGREGSSASGHAWFENFPGRSQFEFKTDGLPEGSYHLYVGTDERGEFTVSDGFGKLEFSSPMETGKRLLTFDPCGMQISVHDGSGEVLSSFDAVFECQSYGYGGDHDHDYDCEFGFGMGMGMGRGMDDCVDDGEKLEVEVDLVNTGQLGAARGEVEWGMTTSHVEFSVEIEAVPVGNYPLVVGGTEVGVIVAHEMMHSGVFGRIMFRDPQTYGGYHLDFDPRGQTIEVMQQGNVILTVDFPEE